MLLPVLALQLAIGGAAPAAFHDAVAPVLAYRCSRCHGDDGLAGGLDTTSLAGLMRGGSMGPAVVPGDPEASPMLWFIDGRRGERRRMPPGEPPLDPGEITRIRDWIAAGAPAGASPDTPSLEVPAVPLEPGKPLRITCLTPSPAYIVLHIAGRRQGAKPSAPGAPASWELFPEPAWKRRAAVRVTIAYPRGGSAGAELEVEHGRTHERRRLP